LANRAAVAEITAAKRPLAARLLPPNGRHDGQGTRIGLDEKMASQGETTDKITTAAGT
jgi:hypothetical protein